MTCDVLESESASALTRADCQCLSPTSLSVTSCCWLEMNPQGIFTPRKLVNPPNQGLPTNPNPENPLLNTCNSPVLVVSNRSDANPGRHAASVRQTVTVPEPGPGLYQQMSKLDILAATASTITPLGVVTVSVCVHDPVSENQWVSLCTWVCLCVCVPTCVYSFICLCVYTLPEAPATSAHSSPCPPVQLLFPFHRSSFPTWAHQTHLDIH